MTTETKDMNRGVQILLERMESNPEEFHTDNTKWLDLLGIVMNRVKQLTGERPDGLLGLSSCYLTDDEVIVLHTKLQQIKADEFTHRVMERLLSSDEKPYPYSTGAIERYSTSSVGYPKSVIASPDMLGRIKKSIKGNNP